MTEYLWGATFARGETLFGEPPGQALEQRLLDHFQTEPNRVVTLIETIGAKISRGDQIKSGWALLDYELNQKPADAKATDQSERTRKIVLAEAWIRNAGGYLDNNSPLDPGCIEDELFGDRGRLRNWPELKDRMLALWATEHERFVQAELEAHNRQISQGDTYRRLRKQPARTNCHYCGKRHRSTTNACADCRHLLADDYRYTPDLAYLEQLAPDTEDDT